MRRAADPFYRYFGTVASMLASPRALVRSRIALSLVALSLIALSLTSCARIERRGKSPLPPLRMSPESVTVEKFSARFPFGDADLNGPLWNDVDEQCFSPELRRRLAVNGLRVGLVGSQMPAPLERLFASQAPPPAPPQTEIVDLVHEPAVLRGLVRTLGGQRSLVIAAGERERIASMDLFQRRDDGGLTGRTFHNAMGVLAMRFFPQGDGRTRFEIVPELQHGEPQGKAVAGPGTLQYIFEPPTEVFHDLRMETPLGPGQMLVITCLPDRPGSLGHHFFTEQRAGQPMQQKMLLFRLAHSPLDDRFSDDEGGTP